MELTDGVRLSSPDAFLLLWVIPPLIALSVLAALRRRRTLVRFAGDRSRPHAERRNARPFKGGLLVAAVVLIVVALARPGWTPETRTVERRGRDVVFVVDTSRSMLAQDLAPNRLERAKLAILDTLEVLRGDRVALVAFAGTAVVKSPLTFDYGFVRLAVERLSTDSTSRGGTLIGDALRVVRDSVFEDQVSPYRDVVLITDGGDLGSLPLQAAGELGALGARIVAVGLGDEVTGQPIPDPDAGGGYLEYEGQPVLTTLDAEALRELAGVTPGGRYVNVGTGNVDLGVLYTQLIAGADRQLLERTEREVFQERFQPFLAAALVLLALEFLLPDLIRRRRRRGRRGAAHPPAAAAVLFAVAAALVTPAPARAVGVPERAERDGRQAFADGRFMDAAGAFSAAAEARPGVAELLYDGGISAYRAGDLESAAGLLRQAVEQAGRSELQAAGHFALGNLGVQGVEQMLAEQGGAPVDPQAAIAGLTAAAQSYRRALDLHPDWEDAAHNLEATRLRLHQLLQHLPPPEQPEESQEQQGQQRLNQAQQGTEGEDEEQEQSQDAGSAQEPQPAPGQEDEELEPDELARAIIAEEEERAEQRRQEQLPTEPVERDW
ncbi:MAG: VWA domain-containing protein [Spirochaetaceae bacterium]|nr:VWA domain-containing protein [Spirochaetaceae bacterium]